MATLTDKDKNAQLNAIDFVNKILSRTAARRALIMNHDIRGSKFESQLNAIYNEYREAADKIEAKLRKIIDAG